MNTRRRLALLIVALPIAFYGYACSSDSTDNPPEEDGGPGNETGPNPGMDSSTTVTDSSTGTDSSTKLDAGDANDGAVPVVCIGNPLTADGGTFDGGVTLDAAATTQIVTVLAGDFLDGPQWYDADGGFLVYSEYNTTAPQILRVAPDGGANVPFRTSGFNAANGPLGSAVRNGVLVTAVNAQNGTGKPQFYLSASDGGDAGAIALGDSGSSSPNDLVVGPANNLYFTDGQYQITGNVGVAGLYRVAGDGGVFAVQQNFGRANGIAISPDLATLYVGIGPLNGGDPDPKAVKRYTVSATGAVGAATDFLLAADLVDVPDGMAVDVGGNLWVAEAVAGGGGGGRVEVFSPAGKKLGTIPFAAPQRPTSVAFGGADSKTLFVTTETGVFTYASRCAGVR